MNLGSHAYESYTASNSEWVDKTPSEWEEKRVKDLFRLVTDKAPVDNDHELLSLYASIGVRPRKDLEARGNKASSTDGYWLVKKGDIVVNKLLAWMGSVGLSEYDGVTSPAYDVLRKTSKLVDVRYFSYLFRTEIAMQIFKRNSRGIMDMRLRLYFDKLGAITVPFPPFSTQQAIATYIDTKTAQIDRQIDLLSQKATQYGKLKQSLINEAVTHGLDKSVPMKDSGIEWIGDVPLSWALKRHKDNFQLVTDRCADASLLKVGLENIEGKTGRFIKTDSEFDGDGVEFKENDILFGKLRPYLAKVYLAEFKGNAIGDIFVYRPKRTFTSSFGKYLMQSDRYIDVINSSTAGAKMPRVSSDFIANLPVATPQVSEQIAIAAYLDSKTAQVDLIVNAINSQIDKLKDLRKALINDVVTGKIKVVSEGPAA